MRQNWIFGLETISIWYMNISIYSLIWDLSYIWYNNVYNSDITGDKMMNLWTLETCPANTQNGPIIEAKLLYSDRFCIRFLFIVSCHMRTTPAIIYVTFLSLVETAFTWPEMIHGKLTLAFWQRQNGVSPIAVCTIHKRVIVGLSQSAPSVGWESPLHAWLASVNWIGCARCPNRHYRYGARGMHYCILLR